MALEWQDFRDISYLDLPIAHLRIAWSRKEHGKAVFDDDVILMYKIQILDGGEGQTFAEKEVPAADMDTLKQQALDFLREKIQETLAIIDNPVSEG